MYLHVDEICILHNSLTIAITIAIPIDNILIFVYFEVLMFASLSLYISLTTKICIFNYIRIFLEHQDALLNPIYYEKMFHFCLIGHMHLVHSLLNHSLAPPHQLNLAYNVPSPLLMHAISKIIRLCHL